MNNVFHHQHIRKRIYKNLEQFPSPDSKKYFLDKLIYIVGVLGPLSTIPQIYTIFIEKNAAGVSVATWLIYFLFSVIWIVYGVVHKEKVIILTYSLWFVMNGLVALGAIIY